MIYIPTENEAGMRLDSYLASVTGESRNAVVRAIDEGRVKIAGKIPDKKLAVSVGLEIEYTEKEAEEYEAKPENIPLDIVYQDSDFAVINKAKGMTVHVGNGATEGTLVNALLYALDSLSGIGGVLRPGIVHRIDKDTTGLLVVAKNDKSHVSLASQIAQKTCRRTYYALLEGELKEDSGRVVTDIGRHPTDRLKMAVLADGRGKTAVTDFKVIARFGKEFTLCQFDLQTGRTHQIRVHAQHLHHPVAGDPVYGFKKQKLKADGQLLHAQRLELTHPTTGKRMAFTAPLPPAFAEIVKKLCKQFSVKEEALSMLFADSGVHAVED